MHIQSLKFVYTTSKRRIGFFGHGAQKEAERMYITVILQTKK